MQGKQYRVVWGVEDPGVWDACTVCTFGVTGIALFQIWARVRQTGVEAFIEHEWMMRIARLSTSRFEVCHSWVWKALGPAVSIQTLASEVCPQTLYRAQLWLLGSLRSRVWGFEFRQLSLGYRA